MTSARGDWRAPGGRPRTLGGRSLFRPGDRFRAAKLAVVVRPKAKDLELLVAEQLEDYLAALETEAARVKKKIAAKKADKSGAEGPFKS